MFASAVLPRLLIVVVTLGSSMFFATEGFATANARAAAHSNLAPDLSPRYSATRDSKVKYYVKRRAALVARRLVACPWRA